LNLQIEFNKNYFCFHSGVQQCVNTQTHTHTHSQHSCSTLTFSYSSLLKKLVMYVAVWLLNVSDVV